MISFAGVFWLDVAELVLLVPVAVIMIALWRRSGRP